MKVTGLPGSQFPFPPAFADVSLRLYKESIQDDRLLYGLKPCNQQLNWERTERNSFVIL